MGQLYKYLVGKSKRRKQMKIKMRWFWMAIAAWFIYKIIRRDKNG